MSRDPRKDRAHKRRLRRREQARERRRALEVVLLGFWDELACTHCGGRGCSWPWGGYQECEWCGGQCYDHKHPLAPHAQDIAAELGLHWPELWLDPED